MKLVVFLLTAICLFHRDAQSNSDKKVLSFISERARRVTEGRLGSPSSEFQVPLSRGVTQFELRRKWLATDIQKGHAFVVHSDHDPYLRPESGAIVEINQDRRKIQVQSLRIPETSSLSPTLETMTIPISANTGVNNLKVQLFLEGLEVHETVNLETIKRTYRLVDLKNLGSPIRILPAYHKTLAHKKDPASQSHWSITRSPDLDTPGEITILKYDGNKQGRDEEALQKGQSREQGDSTRVYKLRPQQIENSLPLSFEMSDERTMTVFYWRNYNDPGKLAEVFKANFTLTDQRGNLRGEYDNRTYLLEPAGEPTALNRIQIQKMGFFEDVRRQVFATRVNGTESSNIVNFPTLQKGTKSGSGTQAVD